METKNQLDLKEIRAKVENKTGKRFWRSLNEIAETEEFQKFLHHEFPNWKTRYDDPVTRRTFLKYMGASVALAGLSGCGVDTSQPMMRLEDMGTLPQIQSQSLEKIAPYVKQPEQLVAGVPLYFATAMSLGGFAKGVLARSDMGRPTKLEGNPSHLASLGATDAITQARILDLYDPERAQTVKRINRISAWDVFVEAMKPEMAAQKASQGAGLRILSETIASPTLRGQISALLEEFPEARVVEYDPAVSTAPAQGARLAFGQVVDTVYDFTQAKVVVSLDADFTNSGPASVRYAKDFSTTRNYKAIEEGHESRLYMVESTPTPTGSLADNRLPMNASAIEHFAHQLMAQLEGGAVESDYADWLAAVAEDLLANTGHSVVIAGDYQSPAVHALAHAMNEMLGNVGTTVNYIEPVHPSIGDQIDNLHVLVEEMQAGTVELLVILGGNPAFNAPADFNFSEAMNNVPLRVHHTFHENETSVLCHWRVPRTHPLEMWSDAVAFDGTVSIVQPLIEPLYDDHSEHEMIATLMGEVDSDYDLVRDYWMTALGEPDDFETVWQTSIHDGVMADTASAAVSVSVGTLDLPEPVHAEGVEVTFRPDSTIWDGRFINNGWLQELPKPMSKLTWDNGALISPRMAEEMHLHNGDMLSIEVYGNFVEAPVWIVPGQPHQSIALSFGYGRAVVGKVGEDTGFNNYAIRSSVAMWAASASVFKINNYYQLASTQDHFSMEGRDIVREMTLEELLHPHDDGHDDGHHGGHGHGEASTVYGPAALSMHNAEEHAWDGAAWGLTVDLTTCNGCNACVTACNAENNIAIVGKEQVLVGREMHWMRIDRYFGEDLDNPRIYNQPVMCMHCEQAPCEVVCPVAATVHSKEGLNDMVYNRCVGTRFCANNCPYKVRRFNFYQFQDAHTPIIQLRHNPDVTVRARGVMEKCSYCVQRINAGRQEAKKENRAIADGEVVTACQQACPMNAIVFGNVKDETSQVHETKTLSRNYGLLAELNTAPRTTYLSRVINPHPALVSAMPHADGHGDEHHDGQEGGHS